jgi:hypothetical protein
MTRIKCTTVFDITATGTRGYHRSRPIPYRDQSGQDVSDDATWQRSRNQQRNWETINQVISLRTLPENISIPQRHDDVWSFEFNVPNINDVAWGADVVGALRFDANNVPMLVDLESRPRTQVICCYGDDANTWFLVMS